MMMNSCSCIDLTHEHHKGRGCDRPAIAAAEEIDVKDGKEVADTELGSICLECYQLIAVHAHEVDPNAVVDLNVPPSFLMCETPALG